MNPPNSKKEKILIIESDGFFGEGLAAALRDAGYTVALSSTAAQANKDLMEQLPHLVLLDVTLPDGSGYDVLKKKQAEPMLAKIPVFLISSQGMPINMREVPQGSVAEYIVALHADPQDVVAKVNGRFGYSTTAAPASVGDGKKLLWVEDDKLIGTILAKKLVASGFDLHHAKNGEEALDMLKNMVPDVIVLDLLLPGMNGFDILQSIKMMDGRLANVPIMILSNLSKQSDMERATMLGAKKFLVKASTSLDDIVAQIRELCP